MFTTLKDFPFDKTKATRENIEDYNRMLNCIKIVENGGQAYTDENPMLSFVWSEVCFIGTLSADMKRIPTNTLKTRLNMMKTVIMRMSELTYREFLSRFPIPIYFDGSCLTPLYSDPFDSFIGRAYESLGECGIDTEETDLDDVIGDNLHELTCCENMHPVLTDFYRTFYLTEDILLKRNKKREEKHRCVEVLNDFDSSL